MCHPGLQRPMLRSLNLFHVRIATSQSISSALIKGMANNAHIICFFDYFRRQLYTLVFRRWCSKHAGNLMHKRLLGKLWPAYWSGMATIVNAWRLCSVHSQIKEAWRELFGDQRAARLLAKLPPRPLRGRWGTKATLQTLLLLCSRQDIPVVFS